MPDTGNQLASWYLAFLRKDLQDKQSAQLLTPMSLVEADRELLKQHIENSARVLKQEAGSHLQNTLSEKKKLKQVSKLLDWTMLAAMSLPLVFLIYCIQPQFQLSKLFAEVFACFIFLLIILLFLFMKQKRELTERQSRQILDKHGSLLDLKPEEECDAEDIAAQLGLKLQQETELSKQKELLIFNGCSQLLCQLNGSGTILDLNDAACQLLSFSRQELISLPLHTLLTAESKSIFAESMERSRKRSMHETIEIRIKPKSGEPLDFSWRVEWSESANSYFCLAEDISAARSNERLHAEVDAMINHDLRAPISSMSVWVDNMLLGTYGEVSEIMNEALLRSSGNLKTVLSLLDNLLDGGKLEAGRMKVLPSEFKLQNLFEHVYKLHFDWFKSAGITLELEQTQLSAFADFEQCCRILGNFFSNAIKWTPEGKSVTMRAQSQGDFVIIEVEDSGPGISAELSESLFQRWGAGNPLSRKSSPSAGLGLYIAKKFAELQGGAVGVRSAEKGGSVFWFSLPVKKK